MSALSIADDFGEDQLAASVRGLSKAFGEKVVLDGLDLDLERGEFFVLLGPSGTGKTTLLRILAGLERADSGEVLVPDVVTTVYQEPRLIPSSRAISNVMIGQRVTKPAREAAKQALVEVGLGAHARRWPNTLSGGEAQRVALARALVREPQLLLLDEPFAALDALTRLQMQDLVADLCARHRPAVLLVTHDVEEAVALGDRVAVLNDGHFVADVRIDSSRPRDRASQEFIELQAKLLADLGVHNRSGVEAADDHRD